MAIAVIALLLLAFMPQQPGAFGIAWRLSLCALGFGLFFAPNSRLLIGQAPKARAAAAGGLLSTSRLSGQTLAAAMVGILLSLGHGRGPPPMLVAGAHEVVAALCSFARYTTVKRSGATLADLKRTR
jgi:DHA2 family multidrug resistance protein-like MFS transporter